MERQFVLGEFITIRLILNLWVYSTKDAAVLSLVKKLEQTSLEIIFFRYKVQEFARGCCWYDEDCRDEVDRKQSVVRLRVL